ncbi:WEB family protein, chloroplastic [Ananas comosus]|nr:WEB family protein, chloroplastic [Ananas comosus]
MQQQLSQLQEELKKEQGEKNRALKEIAEMRKEMINSRRGGNEDSGDGGNNRNGNAVETLEKEVKNAKDSERKMLESLVAQTKQLEQTKILLEEAKLVIRSLQESKKSLETASDSGNLEEITILRNELKLAVEAEENSKKAMDDLAIALKEVTTEASWVKERFSEAQAKLEKVRAEAESSRALFDSMEEKLRLACEESERLKSEGEESVAAWNEKERGFLNCMKMCEEEINKAKQEKVKLIESQKVTREENSKLRDVLKQAVNEATVAKEALEIARSENSQLKDLILEKENESQSIKQEFENLKVSEAAAKDEIKELSNLIATTKSTAGKSKLASSSEVDIWQRPKWKEERPRIQNGRRHSIGEPAKFKVPVLDTTQKEDWFVASLSNVSDMKATSSIATDYMEHEYDLVDGTHLDGMENSVKQKKKKTILRRFGDLLRRSNFRRSNSSSLRSS